MKLTKQAESLEHCIHVLKVLTRSQKGPEFWEREDYKGIRECLQVIKSQPDRFPIKFGDRLPDGSVFSNERGDVINIPALTDKYISSIATFKPLGFAEYPILQVVSVKMYEEGSSNTKDSAKVHLTHLRLCDGSKDVMTGRLPMHLSHGASVVLLEGDIIELQRFTPLTYRDSGSDKPQRSPAVLIHTFSKMGYNALPKKLNDPIHCIEITKDILEVAEERPIEEAEENADGTMEMLLEVDCTSEHRYCAAYGLNPVLCICETDPVSKVNLEVIRQYYHFATKDVSKMDNSNKRNMLYWWYMTNIYNICGKSKREDPPACLKATIRKEYPEESGWYKKYQPGASKKRYNKK